KRRVKIGHLEIRQRERVSRPATAAVHADDGTLLARPPTLPFALSTRLERGSEELRPKAARAGGVVRRKLNQRQAAAHMQTITPAGRSSARRTLCLGAGPSICVNPAEAHKECPLSI